MQFTSTFEVPGALTTFQEFTVQQGKWTGLPRWLSGWRTCLPCRRHQRYGFASWVRKIPWRRAQQPPPACLPGESHGQRSLEGCSQQRKAPAMTKAPERSTGKWTHSSHWGVTFGISIQVLKGQCGSVGKDDKKHCRGSKVTDSGFPSSEHIILPEASLMRE